MPTYEYECREGHRFELFQKMSDEPAADCPECGAPARRKISGGAGFLFKGEGFYITDYRSDDYRKKASAEQGGSGSSDSPGGKKGDAAPGKKTSEAPASGDSATGAGGGGADE